MKKILKFSLLIVFGSFFLSSKIYSATNEELQTQIEILAEEIEKLKLKDKNPKAERFFGLGQSASAVYSVVEGLSIGGYGEIVLNMPEGEDQKGNPSNTYATGEALRGIVYFGNKFSDKWILNTEIEIEHTDEVFLEFAYLDYLASPEFNIRTGLILVPLGLVNEAHEPIYFPSVNRPELETKILPSTWREIGAGLFGTIGNFVYKTYFINAHNADGFTSDGLRGGRKKGGAEENASTTALVFRGDYQFGSSLTLGGGFYKGTASSNLYTNIGITKLQLHGILNIGTHHLRGLWVQADLDDTVSFNQLSGENVAEKMSGFYVEYWKEFTIKKAVLSPFVRYEELDTQEEMATGFTAEQGKDLKNIYVGLTLRPIDRIIYKLDYVIKENDAETGISEFNLGMGYLF